VKSIKAAEDSLKKLQSKDNSITVVNPNPRQPKAYPICTFTYVIVPLKSSHAPELKKFIDWAVTKGQKFGPPLLFVPLTKIVTKVARKTTARLHT
jgi:phosphate transport system substrate-binding protein